MAVRQSLDSFFWDAAAIRKPNNFELPETTQKGTTKIAVKSHYIG